MSNIKNWSKTPGDNASSPPDGAPENWAPSAVNNTLRQQMADHRTQWEDAAWFNWGHVLTRQSNNSFVVSITYTDIGQYVYTEGRRLRMYDSTTIYGAVIAATASGANTLVTVSSSSLSTSLSSVDIAAYNPSTPILTIAPFGQCQLQYVGTTSIKLVPYNGNYLTINGKHYKVPSAGVSLANTGLTAATLYYIYAYMSSGTMTLEASATGYATDSSTGVTIKSGDATRTLVGMVYMDSGTPGTFADSATKRWVRSKLNDRGVIGESQFSTARSYNSGSWGEINSEIRVNFISWSGERIRIEHSGNVATGPAQGVVSFAIGIDSTSSPQDGLVTWTKEPVGGAITHSAVVLWTGTGLSEGNHYATLLASTSVSAAVFNADDMLYVTCHG